MVMLRRHDVARRWPGVSWSARARRTFHYFIRWLLFEVLLAIVLAPLTVVILLALQGDFHSLNEVMQPRDLFLLSGGLLFGRMSDVFDTANAWLRTILVFAFLSYGLGGILAGAEIQVEGILSPARLHFIHLWSISIVYTLLVILLIAITWALSSFDSYEAGKEAP